MKSANLEKQLQTLALCPVPQLTITPSTASHQVPSAASRTYERFLAPSGLTDPSNLSDDKEIILPPLKFDDNTNAT